MTDLGEQDCLVLWPEVGDDWTDTGDGGLFSYLVYRGLGRPERTYVDVSAHLNTPHIANTLDRALEAQLWAPPFQSPPILGSTRRPRQPEGWSVELRAAIYLGSTDKSLVRRDTGEHLQVCRENLTHTGDAIAHALDFEYGWPGEILTLLSPDPHGGFLGRAIRILGR